MPTKEKAASKAAETTNKTPVDSLLPELVTLLEAGVHFGHERSKRNPKMEKFVFMQRNRVAIIDLEQTQEYLKRAAHFVYETAKVPSNEILFVGTKRQARGVVKKYAEATKQPYVTKRWLGGTLTNFSTILKSIEKLDELKRTADSPQVAKLTKKEKAVRQKEMERLEGVLEGVKNMKTLPAAMIVVGAHDERIAVREAKRVGVPVIGITDTNADPSIVDFPVPGNDDAIRSIDLLTSVLAQAIAAARGQKLEVSKQPVAQKEEKVAE